ncbi:MAG: hypothetical protein Q9170_003760, partial [Blastenia crenularia]
MSLGSRKSSPSSIASSSSILTRPSSFTATSAPHGTSPQTKANGRRGSVSASATLQCFMSCGDGESIISRQSNSDSLPSTSSSEALVTKSPEVATTKNKRGTKLKKFSTNAHG